MRNFLILIMVVSSLLVAANNDKNNSEAKKRAQKQLEKEMENEKKYAKEQTFYNARDYDFKGAEVNKDSLDSVPEIPVDDFNIDSVYD